MAPRVPRDVPIGLILIPLVARYVPTDRPSGASVREPLDLPGIAWLGCGLVGGMIGLALLGDMPAGWVFPCIAALVIAVVGVTAFLRHAERAAHPLVAPMLIHGRGFGAVNLVNFIYGGVGMGMVALIPLYATNRYGFGALDSGTLMAAEAAGAIVFSTLGAMSLRHTGYRPPLYAGAVVIALGMVMLAVHPVGVSTYLWLAIGAALIGIGIGGSSPASRNAGLQLVPKQAAAISALRSSGIQIGSITAVSVATAIIAHAGNPGSTQSWIYAIFAVLLLLVGLPAAVRIPEHKGAW